MQLNLYWPRLSSACSINPGSPENFHGPSESGISGVNQATHFLPRNTQVAFLQELHCLCFDDPIEAWQFGPVIREVYYIYCYFGSIPIEREYECIALDTTAKAIIDRIIEEKRDLPPWALVTATHEPGKAWSRAYKKGSYSRISVKDMQLYG